MIDYIIQGFENSLQKTALIPSLWTQRKDYRETWESILKTMLEEIMDLSVYWDSMNKRAVNKKMEIFKSTSKLTSKYIFLYDKN